MLFGLAQVCSRRRFVGRFRSFACGGLGAVLLALTSFAPPSIAESWTYGDGGLCTAQNTFFDNSPEAVAKQYTAALNQCDPPSFNEYFMFCEPPQRSGTRGASTFCYTHRTLDFNPDVHLQYGVGSSIPCNAGQQQQNLINARCLPLLSQIGDGRTAAPVAYDACLETCRTELNKRCRTSMACS